MKNASPGSPSLMTSEMRKKVPFGDQAEALSVVQSTPGESCLVWSLEKAKS